MTIRRSVRVGLLLLVPLVVLWIARMLIIGGASPVTLRAADPLAGRISQALTSTSQVSLPIAGKDYKIQSTNYFDNKTWVVVTIKGVNSTITDGLFVLTQVNGVYNVVLGPGTAFPSSATLAMPTDVQQYLHNGGYLYDTVTQ